MNTSEVLDLSKENIQPLKQGRNPVKLGTALQAQTNAELQQKLLAEREQFELLIRMYEGDDPLKPHYDYVHWIEQSFPKHGPESNLGQILENTLTTFKDDERYKQDVRYAELLIKYIDTQPNPIELYQLVYNQGLCTMCAPFYKAWADELDKLNDIKTADQIFELGMRVKAQPLDLLKEAHLRFQLSVGRRMLGHQEEENEAEADYNRQALHKIQKQKIHSIREPTGVPGRLKQQPLTTRNNQANAPFKIYQSDDKECNNYGENYGKVFPKQTLISKENTLKPGPWTQNGGKHRSRGHAPSMSTPTFQVHEDEGADVGNGHHKISTIPRALKPKKDNFTCPLAVFESPDPTKKPMYCKNKVYAGGREFQFEELRAALYNKRYEQMQALKLQQDDDNEVSVTAEEDNIVVSDTNEPLSIDKKQEFQIYEDNGRASEFREIATSNISNELKLQSLPDPSQVEVKSSSNLEIIHEDEKQPHSETENLDKLALESKPNSIEGNLSLFHCQSFTVNTKEAMNVVQEMWNSPSPGPAFGKNARASRPYPTSPVALDESGIFKVPPIPPPSGRGEDGENLINTSNSARKNIPVFSIYSDDEQAAPVPSQTATVPSSPFPVYSDDCESEQPQTNTENSKDFASKNSQNEKPLLPLNIFPSTAQSSLAPSNYNDGICLPLPVTDADTIKLLAFQSDSDESNDELPISKAVVADKKGIIPVPQNIPTVSVSAPTPVVEAGRKSFGAGILPHPIFQDEDKFDDMTCNTKAFDFVLPSSTPLVGHLKTNAGQPIKNCINGSYISEDVKKCVTKQDLSMIFEASKERYSSSSGSSGSKTQGSVCTAANTSIPPVQPVLMEKLAQISANESLPELEKSLGLLDISGEVDPFCTELISRLLSHIGYPKKHHLIGLHKFETDAPLLHVNSNVKLGDTKYSVTGELGKGNYARVLKATRNNQPVALKQQKPAWEWEWYIVQELQSRLPPSMMSGYLHMTTGYIYKNASILESEWAQYGTILSVVNKLKIAGKGNDLHLALLFSIQLISIVEHLHKCRIIHGDIKPDNFVLCSLPSLGNVESCIKLIDFGRSIDMALFPEGTTFTTVVTTDGFQCNEMKEGRPWTYQTDLYGLAGSIYCVLFYDYMKVIKRAQKWQLANKVPRYLMPAVWQEVFTPLLNVESCENLPNLTVLRQTLEQPFKAIDSSSITQSINKLTNVLLNK